MADRNLVKGISNKSKYHVIFINFAADKTFHSKKYI